MLLSALKDRIKLAMIRHQIITKMSDLSGAQTNEATASIGAFSGSGIGGGEVSITGIPTPIFPKGVRPGQWVMLSGFPTGSNNAYFRWYRVVAASELVGGSTQSATLAGPDWNIPAANTTIYLFVNLIAVYEKNMRLEIP